MTLQPASGPPPAPQGFPVQMVSGQVTTVMTSAERDWWNESRDAYMEQTKFTEVTDMRDMDRLLAMELMVFRWTQWMSAGVDYLNDMIDEGKLQAQLKAYSDQITKIKTSMVLSKDARDAAANDGNFAKWFSDLKQRAKIFGKHRENQLQVALTLMNELSGIVTTFDRSDEEERIRAGFTSNEAIVGWIRQHMIPQYKALDEYFTQNVQRYWIQDQ